VIQVKGLLDQGAGKTEIAVSGHGRTDPADLDGMRVCAAVTALTNGCLLSLQAMAKQYPDHLQVDLIEE
jgi:uncharacterized protein YsxB (DUF464 family)